MSEWGEWVWLNGQLVIGPGASVSVFDRSFLLGDGVFETMRARHGWVVRLDEHLARLRAGMELFRLSTSTDDPRLRMAILDMLAANHLQDAAIRLTVSRGIGTAGPSPQGAGPTTLVIAARPYAGHPSARFERGMSTVISHVTRNEQSPLCRVKSTSYAEPLLARFDAIDCHTEDALLLNTRGFLAEATSSNLFALIDERLCTPDLASGCLPGITRATVLALAREAGLEVTEAPVAPETIPQWQEAFLTNSLMGIVPLVRIAGNGAVGDGKPGLVTRRLSDALEVSSMRSAR